MTRLPTDFRRRKWMLTLWILGIGTAVALLWSLWTGLVLGEGYPESYILGPPKIRFSDFTDPMLASALPNPYVDPTVVYPPTIYVLLRALPFSHSISLALLDFLSLASLAFLLAQILRPLIKGSRSRVSTAFLFLALSYPVVFCIDRGNLEIVVVAFMAWTLYFYYRHRDVAGTACLFPAICLKLYPALLLVLLLRRGKLGLAAGCGLGVVAVTAVGFFLFQASPGVIWDCYRQNVAFYRDGYILDNPSLDGSASPWNFYKISLIALGKSGLIAPVNFGFDGPLILASYRAYSILMALLALFCAGYAWLCERSLRRSMIALLLFLTIAAPGGNDYRLAYASIALLLLVLLPQSRRGDWTALVLLALAVLPKKEILLTFIGHTETGYADVPIQVLVNPILILAAMVILLYQALRLQARRPFKLRLR